MTDLMDELAGKMADMEATPDDKSLTRLRDAAVKLVKNDQRIKDLEDQLSDAKQTKLTLSQKTLPDIMNEIGQDRIGLAEYDLDIILSDYVHASIPKDWEQERKDRAFAHLESLGGGDIVKSIMTIPAGKGDLDKMRALASLIQVIMATEPEDLTAAVERWQKESNQASYLGTVSAPVDLEISVVWNTLTSFVKEQSKKDPKPVMDLEAIGATVGETVKIKKRNTK